LRTIRARLEADGHIALYEIYFETGKADVKPESARALGEIAKLLASRPQLPILVVGHTDNVGALDYNRGLSQRRAQSVVEALAQQHGVARDRLAAVGVGMAAPVASNDNEAGRAKNRRVELVKR
jgi:outer membrane protein OmpA-like peptidoglycan-associated protein